jgi:raffinose/stachyose/melibiose transport system permease protein
MTLAEQTQTDEVRPVPLRARHRSTYRVPWWLAVPAVVAALVFRFLPSLVGGAYSFTNWNGSGLTASWKGLGNYSGVFSNPTTSQALLHTLLLAALLVIFANTFGMGIALSLRRTLKSRTLLRALFFLPFALSQLATAYIWQFIFQYNGPLNDLLKAVGLGSWQRVWLADPSLAIYAVLVLLVWQYTGLTMIIYLAGLEGISEDLDDAAAMDGASSWLKFRKVTLPLLAPAITISSTLTLIFSLGAFEQVIALTGGGPVNSTETLATQVYKNTFVYGDYGTGSALAVLLALIVTVLAVAQIGILRARENRLLCTATLSRHSRGKSGCSFSR